MPAAGVRPPSHLRVDGIRCGVEAGRLEPFPNAQTRFPVSRGATLRDTCRVTKVVDDPAASALLGAEGPFACEVPNFAPRETQQRMADAVADAIDSRDALVVEAGTGTGKTFAYLVPALLSSKRVIVSTGTRNLQDQLFHRDLPRVLSILGAKADVALLKGRANYLCRYRLQQTIESGQFRSRTQVDDLQKVRAWGARTRTGDRAELIEVPEGSPLWPRVTSTAENCLGTECPLYDDCFVFKARRRAQDADMVVVNHHLLLSDLALKREGFGAILPEAEAYILDEAHQLPELAGQYFSVGVSARQVKELTADALAECAGQPGALALLQPALDSVNEALRKARLAFDTLPKRGAFAQLEADAGAAEALENLGDALADLAGALMGQAERSKGLASVHARCVVLDQRLQRIAGRDGEDEVRWYELSDHGFELSATPLDLAPQLRTLRNATEAAWIHTSATLAVAGHFDHFTRQMGLVDPVTLDLGSPFDYARQALCWLPPGLPEPAARDYTQRVIETVRPVLEASKGRAFLLFTSHRALRLAAELLADAPWPLFVQGTAPRHQLLSDFRDSGNGVLLGAASFWEGVDVAGEALSVVVIDKLPFASPDDPVLQARLDAVRRAGGNPFRDWQIPAAAIALKQGAGRLIRDVHDRGVLVLCDPRIASKSYGKLFLASLPPMPRTRELADVQRFFGDMTA
ncbi:MAG: ATP-dependent DNA helicase [Xanthomonadales bacterium]|nr:ATP-dependent DNA helicase [Xanthomonadales bacterium]